MFVLSASVSFAQNGRELTQRRRTLDDVIELSVLGDQNKGTPWKVTLPKFNIAPEKWWLEDYFPIGKVTFQGLC